MSAVIKILSQIILNAPNYIFWKDGHSVYQGCNLNFAKLAGFNTPDMIIGKTDDEMPWGKFTGYIYQKEDQKILDTGISILDKEVPMRLSADTQQMILSVSKVPLFDSKNEIVGILGTAIDITARKKAEEKLKVALANERMTKKAKKSFLENMCHDFRTPFSGLLGLTQTLMNRESNKKKKELLEIIAKSAEILLNDLNEIFNFLKLENGIPVLMKQFALADVFHEISATSLPKAKEKNLEFKLTLDKKVPTHLIGDKFRTKRILENLVSNALKFTDHGEVVLKAELAKDLDKKLIVKFTIQDTGIGIPKDAYNFIFEPLSRISPSYEDLYEGKGLGLKLVKTFLEDLKGEIHINSTPNVGSIFQVFIPYKKSILDRKERSL